MQMHCEEKKISKLIKDDLEIYAIDSDWKTSDEYNKDDSVKSDKKESEEEYIKIIDPAWLFFSMTHLFVWAETNGNNGINET